MQVYLLVNDIKMLHNVYLVSTFSLPQYDVLSAKMTLRSIVEHCAQRQKIPLKEVMHAYFVKCNSTQIWKF